tara:strand:- start:346 stop:624 length:279 start_codon:yes stop_codon:yes gene_type:complete
MRIEDIISEIKIHDEDWKHSTCACSTCATYMRDAKKAQEVSQGAINALIKGNLDEALECLEESCRLELIYDGDSTWEQSLLMLDQYIQEINK